MKLIKYTSKQANIIDLDTKVIYKYPTPTEEMDIGRMTVNGRHPEGEDTYLVEHESQFVMYVMYVEGELFTPEQSFALSAGDVLFVPRETPFAVSGEFEYITVSTPAYKDGQAEILKINE